MSFFTDHIHDTDNPQTYWQHFWVAFKNSAILMWASLLGMIHAIFPWWFPFYTSTRIIRAFKVLVDSNRHKEELKREGVADYLKDEYTK